MLVKLLRTVTVLHRQFGTSAACNRSFTLSFIIPGNGSNVETETFDSTEDLLDCFPGFRFTDPNTNKTFSPRSLPLHIDPNVTYIAKHPFLPVRLWHDYDHNQITDKAFEDKAINALERHLKKRLVISRHIPENPSRQDGWRFLTGEKDVAEWEGIWESCDGHFVFLEAKHFVDLNKIPPIRSKLRRSVDFLGVNRSKATVYVAGNHWLNEAAKNEARNTYGYGVLSYNGLNLDILGPIGA